MTIDARTQIAAMAMQGFIQNDREQYPKDESTIAKESIKYADALLAELERTKPAKPVCEHDWRPTNFGLQCIVCWQFQSLLGVSK